MAEYLISAQVKWVVTTLLIFLMLSLLIFGLRSFLQGEASWLPEKFLWAARGIKQHSMRVLALARNHPLPITILAAMVFIGTAQAGYWGQLVLAATAILGVLFLFRLFVLAAPRPLPAEPSEMMLLGNAGILVCVVASIYALIRFVPFIYHPPVDTQAIGLIVQHMRGVVAPEPVERMQYIVGVVALPFSVLFFGYIFRKVFSWFKPSRLLVTSLVWAMSIVGAISLACFLSCVLQNHPAFGSVSAATQNPWLLVPVSVLLIGSLHLFSPSGLFASRKNIWSQIGAGVYYAAALAMAGTAALSHVFNKNTYRGYWPHFDAVFYSMSQVLGGKTLLVDISGQYGLYPHFIEPVLRIMGGTVFHFSLLMSSLLGLCFLLLAIVSSRLVKNRIIAFLGFLAVVYMLLQVKFFSGAYKFDPYYQYFPIRILFPCLLLFMATHYFMKPRRILYYGMLFCAACGLLWNLDTGVIVFLSVVLTLVFSELISSDSHLWHRLKKSLHHVAMGAGMAAGVFFLYSLFAFIRSGHMPDFARLAVYQKIFYQTGFMMLPMPQQIHPWQMLAAVYIIGLLYSLQAFIYPAWPKIRHQPQTENKSGVALQGLPKTVMVFFITVLGMGVFSYYQGRSHDYNLYAVSYPAWILITIFADELWAKIVANQNRWAMLVPYLAMALFVFAFPCIGIFENGNKIQAYFERGLESFQTTISPLDQHIALIRKHTHPGDKVFIDSPDKSGTFHAESLTLSASDLPGPVETILQKDLDNAHEFLETNAACPLFVDLDDYHYLHTLPKLEGYAVADKSPDGKFLELKKILTLDSQPEWMPNNHAPLLHYNAVPKSGYPEAVFFPRLILPKRFSLEILARPFWPQAGHATLVSNCANTTVAAGVVLQKSDIDKDRYEFSLGKNPEDALTFNLAPDQWHYLVVVVQDNMVRYYHNGTYIKTVRFALPMENSTGPLFVGNTIGQGGAFNGQIRELRICQKPLSANEIKSNWSSHQQCLAAK